MSPGLLSLQLQGTRSQGRFPAQISVEQGRASTRVLLRAPWAHGRGEVASSTTQEMKIPAPSL